MDQFKVVLSGVAPLIWRTIQVPETYSFWELHVALQDSMGWLDCHLHLFRVSKPVTGEVVHEDLLAVIRNPSHEEYENTLQWLGGRFDPEKFDPSRAKFDDLRRRWELAFERFFEGLRRLGRGHG